MALREGVAAPAIGTERERAGTTLEVFDTSGWVRHLCLSHMVDAGEVEGLLPHGSERMATNAGLLGNGSGGDHGTLHDRCSADALDIPSQVPRV